MIPVSDPKLCAARKHTVGKFIQRARENAGLTQKQIADGLGYTTAQFVSNWERGIAMPPLSDWAFLRRRLGVTKDEVAKAMGSFWRAEMKVKLQVLRALG
jgi:ribosome-binding protein aMBF1 (putative translation factor)